MPLNNKEMTALAIQALEAQQEKIAATLAELRAQLGAPAPTKPAPPAPAPSRIISPEGKKRIAAAQKKRWKALKKAAAAHAGSTATPPEES